MQQGQDKPYSFVLDKLNQKKRIGLIALSTDLTVEADFRRILTVGDTAFYVNRLAFANPTTEENLRLTGPDLIKAATDILPGIKLHVLAYACTSASIVLGNKRVEEYLRQGKPDCLYTTPSRAAIAAFKAMGITRISLLSPYSQRVSSCVADYFIAAGQALGNMACLNIEDDRDIARVSPESIKEIASRMDHKHSDALFISCTAMRSMQCVDKLEQLIGIPVLTSNQSLLWHCMRLTGDASDRPGYGRLFAH